MGDRERKNQEQFNEQFAELPKLWKELNTLKLQLQHVKDQEEKKKSDWTYELSWNFAELEEKVDLLAKQVEDLQQADETQNIADLEEKIREELQLVKEKLWTQYFQLKNPQTSYSFVSTEFADEWRKESSDKIPQLAKKASKDKSRFIRKIIAPLMGFASA